MYIQVLFVSHINTRNIFIKNFQDWLVAMVVEVDRIGSLPIGVITSGGGQRLA